ncbi:pentapeptide repeat-containing protein [Pseudomonas sp. ZS001]|uniref:pentapeptide repeat-containing protein n=1 Tax=Pseudomonas sp. ZS001 TaxID=3138070 RepID=UPI0040537D9D
MMDETPPEDTPDAEAPTTSAVADIVQRRSREALLPGNREVIADLYVSRNVENGPKDYAFKVYVRLNAKKQTLRKVSFQHSVLVACYFNKCIFDACDFTGCRFVGCNFHQSSFSGSKRGKSVLDIKISIHYL